MATGTLLVTCDGQLAESVRPAVETVSDCRLETVSEWQEALERFRTHPIPLAFVHVKDAADEARIEEALRLSRAGFPGAVVVISESHDTTQALRAFRGGAIDYLARPLSLSRVAFLTDVFTIRARRGQRQAARSSTSLVADAQGSFLYCSPEMEKIVEQVRTVAPLQTTVLVTGETGTGKTRLARLIHELSPRRERPFVAVSCGALTNTLVESEIFGHVQGAFTGADRDRDGKLTTAADGTLMLDEIDALPLSTQAKLLRVIDERSFEAVGSDEPQRLGARLVVCSNRNLDQLVTAGRFRSDLFYRVNVVSFRLPPLRDRTAVIRPLVEKCLDEFARSAGAPRPKVSNEVFVALESYHWPGNIRELRNVVERLVALCRNGRVGLPDLPGPIQRAFRPTDKSKSSIPAGSKWQRRKDENERELITAALTNNGNNRARTARDLGISRVTLYKKLQKFGLG